MLKNFKKSESGFTLSELIITLGITVLIFSLVISAYILSQQAFRKSYFKYELNQNSRVFVDRLTREIRQTPKIITTLSEALEGAGSEIMFQNGHTSEKISYIKYYLAGCDLKRQEICYYFSDPATCVIWNTTDGLGNPPQENIMENIVAEYIESLKFYNGGGNVIDVEAVFLKNGERIYNHSKISGRNL
ncbi:MAG: hypothetical protein V1655_00960 [bacterium]